MGLLINSKTQSCPNTLVMPHCWYCYKHTVLDYMTAVISADPPSEYIIDSERRY